MTSPRPYVAAAAASVLAALYFVPSASASTTDNAPAAPAHTTTSQVTTVDNSADQLGGLADTGSVDTKPYVIGGAAFLVAGAGLVFNAGRRSRASAV
ncbi:hypothetical protein OG552_22985 [Streptomyces sp. NBC_01476]|uniref:hypothetical protein n=1 Tax=Streptomyces sp. NBC_01476 TaxID=2903881 RepID=UPI002E308385|nr:hypothetical protein [Streptomyces sp. NBC_01476]